MQSRIEYMKVAPDAMKTMFELEKYLAHCGLEPSLIDLIKLRASQINGCAYCIDMYTKDARVRGESEQRLYELVAWRETPFYTERERAALAWTEAVTLIADEQELVTLTLAIVAINGWNRFAISFRTVPGTYQPVSQ
jgi:AhpD family alkylhydroperoxidase